MGHWPIFYGRHFIVIKVRIPKLLADLIEPVVIGLGYECVGIEYAPHRQHGLLRVYIDSKNGIELDDCTKISHQLSGVLDVEDPIPGHYQLEVSSPGLDRLLFKLEHFETFITHCVDIRLNEKINERRHIKGQLITVNDNIIVVQDENMTFEIPFSSIDKARLVADENHLWKKGKRNGK